MSYYLPGTSGQSALGLPLDGLTGQVLAKVSDLDFDVAWITQSGGGGSSLPLGGNPGDILMKDGYANGQADWASTLDGGTFF